jgi:hypothetical protein
VSESGPRTLAGSSPASAIRVSHAGGDLLATARPDGGFIVQARMPRHPRHPAALARNRPEEAVSNG